jgi:hypothetical protein
MQDRHFLQRFHPPASAAGRNQRAGDVDPGMLSDVAIPQERYEQLA